MVGLRIRLLALVLPFICPFFLSLKAKFGLQFSPELCKLESSHIVYIYKSCCVVGLRIGLLTLIFTFICPFF